MGKEEVELWFGRCCVPGCEDVDPHVHCPLCGEIMYPEGEPDTLTGQYECGYGHQHVVLEGVR
jgi:hypothetical protein